MKKIIVTGKGGSGKTTFTQILLDTLIENKPKAKILVIDADPASTLHMKLAFNLGTTPALGSFESNLLERKIPLKEKIKFLEKEVANKYFISQEYKSHKLTYCYMGHHDYNSCLCSYNHTLNLLLTTLEEISTTKETIQNLPSLLDYDFIVIDREAGVEHLSRSVYKSDKNFIFIISWPSEDYLQVAKEINDLADILGTTKNRYLVFNNIMNIDLSNEEIIKMAKKSGIGEELIERSSKNNVLIMPPLQSNNNSCSKDLKKLKKNLKVMLL